MYLCSLLLRRWASRRPIWPRLTIQGGKYFSNGIALNIIENSEDPGMETWRNINAIDDVAEFIVGDTSHERSEFLEGVKPLCERGIVTIACLRGNAAAGGVALAAACDLVIASRGVVLNPAYRAMGLHGSELHT
jgi:enoyl-CoA hydratase/carnithine racemase